jgi:hypothetical protein
MEIKARRAMTDESAWMAKTAFSRARSSLREETGFMLVELLAAIPLLIVVFFGIIWLYDVSVHEQSRGDIRVRSLVNQKNGLERISRELRDAVAVKYKTSEVIDAQIASGGRWLRYDCSGTSCKRYEGPSEAVFDQGPVVVVNAVQSAEFQTLTDVNGDLQPDFVNPTYISVTLKVTVAGATNPIVLDDGFNLRNLTTPS